MKDNHYHWKSLTLDDLHEFLSQVDEERYRNCSAYEKDIYLIPSHVNKIDIYFMNNFMLYCGMSNGSRLTTKKLNQISCLLTELRNDHDKIYENCRTVLHQANLSGFEFKRFFKRILGHGRRFIAKNEKLKPYIVKIRQESVEAYYSMRNTNSLQSESKGSVSPLQHLQCLYKNQTYKFSKEDFAAYLAKLFEKTFVEGLPQRYETKKSLCFIAYASRKNYRFPSDIKSIRQWKHCFTEFLSSAHDF